MSKNNRKIVASHRLEELTSDIKNIIQLLRDDNVTPERAYALVYELRREVGYVTASLGAGVPRSSRYDWSNKE